MPLSIILCMEYVCDVQSLLRYKMDWPFICNTVTDMFNRALIDGVYPVQWKVARVNPIFKNGDSNDPSNYQPISTLPVPSKVFEKHLNQQVQEYLTSNGLLH